MGTKPVKAEPTDKGETGDGDKGGEKLNGESGKADAAEVAIQKH